MDFNDVVERARQGFDVVCKKTEETVTVSKLRLDQAALETKLSKSYEMLGKICYDAIVSEEDLDRESVSPLVDDIVEKTEQIKKIKKEIIRAKDKKQCAKCGSPIDKESVFCNKCGEKV